MKTEHDEANNEFLMIGRPLEWYVLQLNSFCRLASLIIIQEGGLFQSKSRSGNYFKCMLWIQRQDGTMRGIKTFKTQKVPSKNFQNPSRFVYESFRMPLNCFQNTFKTLWKLSHEVLQKTRPLLGPVWLRVKFRRALYETSLGLSIVLYMRPA